MGEGKTIANSGCVNSSRSLTRKKKTTKRETHVFVGELEMYHLYPQSLRVAGLRKLWPKGQIQFIAWFFKQNFTGTQLQPLIYLLSMTDFHILW